MADLAENVMPRFNTAIAAWSAGRQEEAVRICSAIIDAAPDFFGAWHLRAAALATMGDYDAALESYAGALQLRPGHAEVLNNRGVALLESGNAAAAVESFDAALLARPDMAEALNNRGNALRALERYDAAIASYDQALAARPGYAQAMDNRGLALQRAGRLEEALAGYEAALAVDPAMAETELRRAGVLARLDRPAAALAAYDAALALRPDWPAVLNDRANVLLALDRPAEALESCERAIALAPDLAPAYSNRGNALDALGESEAALASFAHALDLDPHFADAFYNKGKVLQGLKRWEAALASYDEALALAPEFVEALVNRATALVELGRPAEAVASLAEVVRLAPRRANDWNNLGMLQRDLGLNEPALCSFGMAIAIDPSHREAHFNRGMQALMLRCDLAQAWSDYDWRMRLDSWTPPPLEAPIWDGGLHPPAPTVVFFTEQGIGDTFQAVRFLAHAAALGVRPILLVPPPLVTLMSGLEGVPVFADATRLPPHQAILPLMSLPRAVGACTPAQWQSAPYLRADPGRVRRWGERLPPSEGLRVGIVWQGSKGTLIDRGRSFPLRCFAPLAALPGVTLISLQKNDGSEQLADLPPGMQVQELPADVDADGAAFADTAAIMQHLDLVITSDTSIAHLAGALGRPVWVLLKHQPDWRWGIEGETTPWYASARLFRQRVAGDWDEVFARVADALAALQQPGRPVDDAAAARAAALNLGIRALRAGDVDAAGLQAEAALARAPDSIAALHLRAACHISKGAMPEAGALLDQAVALAADDAALHLARAGVLLARNRAAEALAAAETALRLAPTLPEAHFCRAQAWHQLGENFAALSAVEATLALAPNNAPAALQRFALLVELAQFETALQAIDTILEANPGWIQGIVDRGAVLLRLDRPAEALECCERGLDDPIAGVAAQSNRATALDALGQHEQAIMAFNLVLARDPANAPAYCGRGRALYELNRFAEARDDYRRGLELLPDFPEARFNAGMLSLLEGDFRAGWQGYEARRLMPKWVDHHLPRPEWDGTAPQGKRLLLYAEQGYGDTLQFIRFAVDLLRQGARPTVFVPPGLVELLAGIPGLAVLPFGAPPPACDAHLPLMSLPHVLGLDRVEDFAAAPYLQAEPDRMRAWEERLARIFGPRDRPRIGLAWRGSSLHRNDRNRSLDPAMLLPLLRDDIDWVCVQQSVSDADAQLLAADGRMAVVAPFLRNFADTAALIAQLDLVISVDTSIAHLAGALGGPVWLMLAHHPDWRWMAARTDSPWYPSARLFRQPTRGDWAALVGMLGAALGAMFPPAAIPRRAAGPARLAAPPTPISDASPPRDVPQDALTASLLGQLGVCRGAGDHVAALGIVDRILVLHPRWPAALNDRGNVLCDLDRCAEAIACFDTALRLDPGRAAVLASRGAALQRLQENAAAEQDLRQALAIDPHQLEALSNLGTLRLDAGDRTGARAFYAQALAISPHPLARFNLSLLELQDGNFAAGWEGYELRRTQPGWPDPGLPGPEWPGGDPRGVRIMLFSEQGYGDTIQFLRFALHLAKAGARVYLLAPDALLPLLRGVPGITAVGLEAAMPAIDAHLPLLSLPWRLGLTTREQLAAPPYLTPDPARVAEWAGWLGPRRRPRIGLAWRGNPRHQNDRRRSLQLGALLPLLRDDIEWVCLQPDPPAAEAALLSEHATIRDAGPKLTDFAQTAALLDQLDLVISVDTSVAHLAGAMGKPLWLLLAHRPDWRWPPDQDETYWYASASLFRQASEGDWSAVLDRVANALAAKFPARGARV